MIKTVKEGWDRYVDLLVQVVKDGFDVSLEKAVQGQFANGMASGLGLTLEDEARAIQEAEQLLKIHRRAAYIAKLIEIVTEGGVTGGLFVASLDPAMQKMADEMGLTDEEREEALMSAEWQVNFMIKREGCH